MKIDKEVELIFEEILHRMYKQAWTRQSTMKWLRKRYDLQTARAYELIKHAEIELGSYLQQEDSTILQECIEVLKSAREKAMTKGDLKEVRETTKEIAKLNQLYIQKLELDVNMEQPLFPKNGSNK